MKIAIDIDNVLVDTTQCVIDYINKRLPNLNLTMDDIKSYYIENALPEEYKWIVPIVFEQSEMWREVKLIKDAAIFVEKLYNHEAEIYFATATTEQNFKKKVGFLTRSFPFFPEGYVRKHSISIKEKQLLGVDYLIDDYLSNFTGDHTYQSILFDYPWNRNFEGMDMRSSIWRCSNWSQIYNTIGYISGEPNWYGNFSPYIQIGHREDIGKKKVKVNVRRKN